MRKPKVKPPVEVILEEGMHLLEGSLSPDVIGRLQAIWDANMSKYEKYEKVEMRTDEDGIPSVVGINPKSLTPKIMTGVDLCQDSDWENAFSWACGHTRGYACGCGTATIVCNGPQLGDKHPFGPEDVTEVIASVDGEHDGENWLGVFRLKNGFYAMLSAGCDYTGWDCQAGGDSAVAFTLPDLLKLGISPEQRSRLGL